jgi:hypothetical protein
LGAEEGRVIGIGLLELGLLILLLVVVIGIVTAVVAARSGEPRE